MKEYGLTGDWYLDRKPAQAELFRRISFIAEGQVGQVEGLSVHFTSSPGLGSLVKEIKMERSVGESWNLGKWSAEIQGCSVLEELLIFSTSLNRLTIYGNRIRVDLEVISRFKSLVTLELISTWVRNITNTTIFDNLKYLNLKYQSIIDPPDLPLSTMFPILTTLRIAHVPDKNALQKLKFLFPQISNFSIALGDKDFDEESAFKEIKNLESIELATRGRDVTILIQILIISKIPKSLFAIRFTESYSKYNNSWKLLYDLVLSSFEDINVQKTVGILQERGTVVEFSGRQEGFEDWLEKAEKLKGSNFISGL